MPRTPKQYFRAILVQLRLFSKAAFTLVLDEIRADDVFLVSFPKSGNTWVRFLLTHLLFPEADVKMDTIDRFIPDVYSANALANAAKSPRVIKTHHALLSDYPKSIYIVRDYRDVMVSYYHYQVAAGEFSGTFSEYLRNTQPLHPFGTWADHVRAAYAFREQHPERILIVHYEQLLDDTVAELRRIAAFTERTGTSDPQRAAERASFKQLQKNEQTHGSELLRRSGAPFFRSGKKGSWQEQFSAADVEFVKKDKNISEAMQLAGYTWS